MDPHSVLSKTAKGREEIETRKHRLEQRLRQLLITVNGKLSAGELAGQFRHLGDVAPLLDQLARDGFVEAARDPADRLKQAQRELSALISEGLGPSGDDVAIRIEAAKTLEDLRAYLESRRAMLDDALGKVRAPAFWTKVSSLI